MNFYTLEANEAFADINKGDVVVNEFMTSNKTTIIDLATINMKIGQNCIITPISL
jgi:hypothetical protein